MNMTDQIFEDRRAKQFAALPTTSRFASLLQPTGSTRAATAAPVAHVATQPKAIRPVASAPAAARPNPASVASERTRIVTIMGSDEYVGREAVGDKLMLSSISAEEIIATLAVTPRAGSRAGRDGRQSTAPTSVTHPDQAARQAAAAAKWDRAMSERQGQPGLNVQRNGAERQASASVWAKARAANEQLSLSQRHQAAVDSLDRVWEGVDADRSASKPSSVQVWAKARAANRGGERESAADKAGRAWARVDADRALSHGGVA
jgi:hypothetical protein